MRAQFGLALNTIYAYARAFSSYFAFSEKENITPELSGRADAARWINEERERGIANATLILRLTELASSSIIWLKKTSDRTTQFSAAALPVLMARLCSAPPAPFAGCVNCRGFQQTRNGNESSMSQPQTLYATGPCLPLRTTVLCVVRSSALREYPTWTFRDGC